MKKRPVILHTDIGTDYDDSWALAMLLCQKRWDIRLILVDTGDLRCRAAAAAQILTSFGRDDVEIGLGEDDGKRYGFNLRACVRPEDLARYRGRVSPDGAERLIEIVEASDEPVSLISIGPCPAVARALEKRPGIARKIRFTGMFGSIALAHEGRPGPIAEYNVVQNIPAARRVFAAPWLEARLTPLDSCGKVRIAGELFQRLADSPAAPVKHLMRQYMIWQEAIFDKPFTDRSSILFDTVAVHLARSTRYLKTDVLRLAVDDAGFTRESPRGMPFLTAVGWKDMPGFERHLVELLLSSGDKSSAISPSMRENP